MLQRIKISGYKSLKDLEADFFAFGENRRIVIKMIGKHGSELMPVRKRD